MVNKNSIVFLFCLILSACGLSDDTTQITTQYYYQDWGRKFITYKTALNQEKIVIDSEIVHYQLQNDIILAVQKPNLLESGNQSLVYWLINTTSNDIQSFNNKTAFIQASAKLGLSVDNFLKNVNS